MAVFEFSCPSCGTALEGNEELCGRTITCPKCGSNLVFPVISRNGAEVPAVKPDKRKKFFFLLLLLAVLLCGGSVVWKRYSLEQSRAENALLKEQYLTEELQLLEKRQQALEKRLEEDKKAFEEKYLARIKRLAEEKRELEKQRITLIEESNQREIQRSAEEKRELEERARVEKIINGELERAMKCSTPQAALEIVDNLINSYACYQDLLQKVYRKRLIFGEGVDILQVIERAKGNEDYSTKISLLENLIKIYPDNPYTEDARKLLLGFIEEKKKIDAYREEERLAAARAEMNRNRGVANTRPVTVARPVTYTQPVTRQVQQSQSVRDTGICRWCEGTGKRSGISSTRDCTFCLGHGKAMSRVERERHREFCVTYKNSAFYCGRRMYLRDRRGKIVHYRDVRYCR